MKSYINDMIVADPNGEKSILYPTTKQEAVEGLQDRLTNIEIPDITTTDQTTLPNSHSGRVLIEHIGGNMEQKSTEGNQLFDKSTISRNVGISTTDGSLYSDSTVFSTDYIDVSNLDSIAWNALSDTTYTWGAFYDENKNFVQQFNNKEFTSNVPSGAYYIRLTFLNEYLDTAMVNSGTEVLPYEEYTGCKPSPSTEYKQEINGVKGKNRFKNTAISTTKDGIDFTVYDDGSVYAKGISTSAGTTVFVLGEVKIPKGAYIGSGCPSGGASSTYCIRLGLESGGASFLGVDVGSGYSFELQEEKIVELRIHIVGGTSVDGLFKPMIRSASVLDDTYVPYGLLRIKAHRKNLVKSYRANAISTDYGAILADAVAYLKNGKTYTISADVTASTTTRAYWNKACGAFENSVNFYVNAGTYRYSYTFVSILDGMPLNKAILSKFASGDGIEITATNLMIEEGTEATPYESYTEQSIILSQPMELYGKDSVQDLLTPREIERKFGVNVFDGSDDENWISSNNVLAGRYYIDGVSNSVKLGMGLCTHAIHINGSATEILNCSFFSGSADDRFIINTSFNTVDEWKAHLQANPMTVVYELAEPTTEPLPIADQIALNSLLSYDGITYVEFDTEVQPTWKEKYGTSEVGGYTLESLLVARNNELKQELALERITALESTLVNNI